MHYSKRWVSDIKQGLFPLSSQDAQVPVGKETLGRIINVIGEPVDEQGPVSKSILKLSWFVP